MIVAVPSILSEVVYELTGPSFWPLRSMHILGRRVNHNSEITLHFMSGSRKSTDVIWICSWTGVGREKVELIMR